jgi:hypothetical protein
MRQEQFILKRLETKRKLFGFLRRHRHELFDDGFQAEMETMYRDTGAGSNPIPPAQLAMALLLQGYLGLSDSDAVEAAVMDLRWQMVLGCLGATAPPFSQGTLQTFANGSSRTTWIGGCSSARSSWRRPRESSRSTRDVAPGAEREGCARPRLERPRAEGVGGESSRHRA